MSPPPDGADGQEAAMQGALAIEVPPPAGIMAEAPPEVHISFQDISCWVPASVGPVSSFSLGPVKRLLGFKSPPAANDQPRNELRQVLYGINGSCEPGSMLALMGPSGGGKTTLLSIVGGRAPKHTRQEGRVLFNGHRLTKRVKRQIGFVLQDDLMYATLTVHETLYFAAMLRLPRHRTKAEKLERVDAVIQALGLTRCRNTIIGDHLRRGVSGGERKRVSVGHELLINPAILLLDEPTSGLDSSAARKLVALLRQLASSGRTIVTTIHQPSSNIYQQLDAVLLLSQGHPIYYGVGSQAATWFDRLGYPCPFGVNIADWILDLASGEIVGKGRSGEEARQHLIACSERYLSDQPQGYSGGDLDDVIAAASLAPPEGGDSGGTISPDAGSSSGDEGAAAAAAAGRMAVAGVGGKLGGGAKLAPEVVVNGAGGGAKLARVASLSGLGGSTGDLLDRSVTGIDASRAGASRWGASYWTQLTTLFVRAVRVRRFESLSTQDLCQFLSVGIVCGLIWWQVGQKDTVYAAENARGLLFFETLFLCLRTMFTALFTFPNEQKMMLKERASGMYRLSAFYLARTASDIPADLTIPSLFIAIIYVMGGLRHGGYFFLNWLSVLLATLVAQTCGLLIGATVMVVKTAQTVAAVVMLTFMLVAGFYVTNIPAWIGWIKWLSFFTYTFSLVMKVEFKGRELWDCSLIEDNKDFNPSDPWNYVDSGQCEPVTDLNKQLHTMVDINGPAWEAGVLVGYLILLRVVVYVVLRRKTQR